MLRVCGQRVCDVVRGAHHAQLFVFVDVLRTPGMRVQSTVLTAYVYSTSSRSFHQHQVVALIYYIMSAFPGGAAGAQFVLNMFWQACVSCFTGVTRTVMS